MDTVTSFSPPAAGAEQASAVRRRQLREAAIELGLPLVALTGIAAVVLIFVFVAREALPLFTDPEVARETDLARMFLPQVWRVGREASFTWQPVGDVPKYSMVPLFAGTLKVTAVAMTVAVPVGVAAAVFSSEFAPRRLREVLKPTIELLAGIPSVVLGFFALMVMATWLQSAFGFTFRLNAALHEQPNQLFARLFAAQRPRHAAYLDLGRFAIASFFWTSKETSTSMIRSPWARPFSMNTGAEVRPETTPPARNRFGTSVSSVSGSYRATEPSPSTTTPAPSSSLQSG